MSDGEVLSISVVAASPLERHELAAALDAHPSVERRSVAPSVDALRADGWGGAETVVVSLGQEPATVDDGAAGIGASGPRWIVLAEAGDDRIGEWLIDGCSVLPRGSTVESIVAAARVASTGLLATSPRLAADALRYERLGDTRRPDEIGRLTPREREVLSKMSDGSSNREIGSALGISSHTAKFHVAQIIAKLDAQSRAHAVAKALRAGIVGV